MAFGRAWFVPDEAMRAQTGPSTDAGVTAVARRRQARIGPSRCRRRCTRVPYEDLIAAEPADRCVIDVAVSLQ